MESLLSLTSRRAGEWFKEELRSLGALDHIVDTGRLLCDVDISKAVIGENQFSGLPTRFVSDLVGNPEDGLSCNVCQVLLGEQEDFFWSCSDIQTCNHPHHRQVL